MVSLPIELLLPGHWRTRARYRLLAPVTLAGVTVPQGFESDGATTPRVLWPWFPPVGISFPGALVHDYLLEQAGSNPHHRHHADNMFDLALRELGVSPIRRHLMVAAVRSRTQYLILKQTLLGQN